MRKTAFCLAGLGAAFCLTSASAAEWQMDSSASNRLEFTASFEGAPAPGVFRQFDTRLRFDPDRPSEASLEVTIAVNSADMRSADVNAAIGRAEWFDFARHSQARFLSTEIRRIDGTRYLARGTLNLKGVQQPVEVPFTWAQGAGTVRMAGELVVRRAAFGIGTGEWAATNVIGADVKIRFDLQLRKGD